MYSQSSQDTQDNYLSNQTAGNSNIYNRQQEEFKFLLDRLSADFSLSFEEKVGELNNILLKQQEEIILNVTGDKQDDE